MKKRSVLLAALLVLLVSGVFGEDVLLIYRQDKSSCFTWTSLMGTDSVRPNVANRNIYWEPLKTIIK
ncbi:hypothetical protein [Sediminispirochaeta bajacaliforniensis]|uniref:hypothetical protein n=1 Tax=Sediminispirochaeta bajacaliforniensis TaxID=148 RepID=UPI0003727E7C|nr:hypothetical protein [Sediminispirochaeta bajacaliforniensis]